MSVVIGGSGLAPEVEVFALGLDLPPHRETGKGDHEEDEQLFHSASLPPGQPRPAQALARTRPQFREPGARNRAARPARGDQAGETPHTGDRASDRADSWRCLWKNAGLWITSSAPRLTGDPVPSTS